MNEATVNYYTNVYADKAPAQLDWTAGTAEPELVSMVYEGQIKAGSKILELGCGLGTEAVFLAVRGMNVTAMDLSEEAINVGKNLANLYGTNVNFIQKDLLESDLFDEEFDIITDHGCYHHMTEAERETYVSKVTKYLKPNGMFILRCFSDMIPGGPQPKRISSDDMIESFHQKFKLEHMERVLSFSTKRYSKPIGWFTIWYKK
ncbi:methyltransferase family protein [Orenia metallireducens]|jgi:cyclopropane fatty-acyl-phospholipid synthase-like methyltransferase|uniref:Methyltransferase domain-containing protein n=1 Tax=Orenia metallireducens TaxID=1413210 RepID=A0A285I3M0_9FIRM|nr:class I SAM-dependent methyltransferase [Orenia metallireducens]PRX23125.1 methyltransferase family protein [Orenia metallireducens]SNY42457.1 Methyltransferase domain-containing protein [Orenia metallireducens]